MMKRVTSLRGAKRRSNLKAWKNRLLHSLCSLAMTSVCLSAQSWSFAEDVSFEATVNTNKITLNETAELTLTLTGVKDADPFVLPAMDGLEVRYIGPSTRISIVNGQYSSEHAFNYTLFPTKAGRFQIPPMTTAVNGRNYTTKAIVMEVTADNANPASGEHSSGIQAEQGNPDKIFMTVGIPRKEVYLSEPVEVKVKVFVNGLNFQLSQAPQFPIDGFTTDKEAKVNKYKEVVNGINYDVLDFRFNIYPMRTGEIVLGPTKAVGDLIYRRKSDDDFFGGFFDSMQSRPAGVTAQPLELNVVPLPEEGKPEDFSGAIGQFELTASVSPAQVKVGDPLTLRVGLRGKGNFKNIIFPGLKDERFKVYDPQIKDEADGKSMEQVIIPSSADIKEVGSIRFSYFDIETKQYRTVSRGPFEITVTPLKAGEEFKAVGFAEISKDIKNTEDQKVQQVDYVQKYIQAPIEKVIAICKTARFWLSVLGIILVWGLWVFWRRFSQRLAHDAAFARRLSALKKAKNGIKEAQGHLNKDQSKEFYDTVFKTLNNYLADKLHLPAGGAIGQGVPLLLQQKKIPQEQINAVKELFDICDMARFAGQKSHSPRMPQDLIQLQSVIASLEKILK